MKKTVLLVEDAAIQRALYASLLEKIGLRVVTAASGEEGLAKARQERPGMILSDYVMPDMNGLELCTAIRKDPRTRDTIFLIFTRIEPSEEEKSHFHDQPDGWLDKNHGPEAIAKGVRAWIEMMG
jgi:CheY-like chemotaxis protein